MLLSNHRGLSLSSDERTGRSLFPPISSQRAFLLSTVGIALALRLVVVFATYRGVAAPGGDYNEFGWEMGWTARSIALGHGFSAPFFPLTGPTALVPPLYVYLLAGIFKLFGLYSAKAALVTLSLNSILSSLTVIPIYFSAKQALHTRVARLTAAGWAIYPFSIYFSATRVWDYALTALLLSLCFWAAQKLHLRGAAAWAGFGVLCGITVLSNPSGLLLLVVLGVLALLKMRRVSGPWLARGVLAAVTFTAVCAPWSIRNHRVMHENILLRDGFWLEFWAGNHGDTSDSNPPDAHPASNPVEMQRYERSGEIAYMEQKQVLAIDFVKHHPLWVAGVTLRRIFRFWTGFWSFRMPYLASQPADLPNFFFCGALTLMLIRGLRRWWEEDRGAVLPYLLTVLVFPVTYYLTHSSMDYRQPIEPVVVLLVVVGIYGTAEAPVVSLAAATSVEDEELENSGSVVSA